MGYRDFPALKLPQDDFDFDRYIEKNSTLEVLGKSKSATDKSALISIDTYDCKITLYQYSIQSSINQFHITLVTSVSVRFIVGV